MLFTVSVSKFPVSFCLIRNLTMFFLVEKKTQKNCVERNNDAAIPIQLWCFSPSFSLKLHQLAQSTAFFMLPWHLSYSESTLWNLWLKKKKKKKKKLYPSSMMCGGHRTHHYVLNLCNLVINVDPVCPIPYLSPALLNHRESQRLQKLSQWCMSAMQRESHASSSVVLLCPLTLWWFTCQ